MTSKLPLILPVETHVRELDGKLLLAAVAAESGRDCYVGSQNEIRARIGQLPRGHFIAKGFASRKARFLTILKQLGFTILAWDEEGLVHPEPEIYNVRRISPQSLALLSGVFSWGADYTQLFKNLPYYDDTPIYEHGNPRLDLLDRRVRGIFSPAAQDLTEKFGKFILLNSNFGRVNSAVRRSRDKGVAGKLTDTTLDANWQAMVEYRRNLYHRFREMFARLCETFPDRNIILRPHPSERIESWQDIPAKYANAHVIYEGSVLPWLLAADVLVHNGCTTALESAMLDKPVIAYQPIKSEIHDWHLPNSVSHSAESIEVLEHMLSKHLSRRGPLVVTVGQRLALSHFVHHDPSRLCSDKIVGVLDGLDEYCQAAPPPLRKMSAQLHATVRAVEKKFRSLLPGDIYAKWHQDKHFPDYSLETIEARIALFRSVTGRFANVRTEKVHPKLFKLTSRST